jgi:hypothetical protein
VNCTGIDHHKRYSVACTLDGQGHLVKQGRIDHNAPEAFAAYFEALAGLSETVIKACWIFSLNTIRNGLFGAALGRAVSRYKIFRSSW